MPVKFLLVEGKLDAEILNALCAGRPTVEQGGSKRALSPEAASRADSRKAPIGFLRDRDFDYDPPGNLSMPRAIKQGDQNVWGWHWSRHCIENYLLEPDIVISVDPKISKSAYEEQLVSAAMSIRFYEAARWAVGIARRALPPVHKLQTFPETLQGREFALPTNVAEDASREWASSHSASFLAVADKELNSETVESNFQKYAAKFDERFCQNVQSVLVWFPGKDLMAAMAEWLNVIGNYSNPGAFRARIRDWIRMHPETAMDIMPEWRSFVNLLRAS